MTTEASAGSSAREPELLGQTVVLIGGSAGIGLETARRARSEGADVILTGRNPERLGQAALDVDARSTAAFDANDAAALKQFFDGLPDPIDHVLVTAGGPHYVPLLEMETADVRDALSDHVVLGLEIARNARGKMRPGGTLLLMGGTGGRKISRDLAIVSAATAVLPPFTAASRSRLPRFASTSSPPASSTPRCRHRSWATDSRPGERSCARRSPSGASSDRPTSPRSPFTS
jgi:NAD(P)-dependent dehydrogenase (short-subunit alcohol dehydrogenase family)